MGRRMLRGETPAWVHMAGKLVIERAADGTYRWQADSHPALRADQVIGRVRSRCTELEQLLADTDAVLREMAAGAPRGAVDLLLDRRNELSGQLRFLRGFLRQLEVDPPDPATREWAGGDPHDTRDS